MILYTHRRRELCIEKKKMIKKLLAGIFCILIIMMAAGCGELDHERAREIAAPLIAESQKLDLVLYGKGLSVSEDKKEGKYSLVVSEEYKTLEDLKAALDAVYTPELSEITRNAILKGQSTEHGTSCARYINVDGQLYSYDGARVYFEHARRYDIDSIRAKNMTDIRIIFTVDTYTADAEGNYSDKAENIELKLIYDEALGKWLLDTPTY